MEELVKQRFIYQPAVLSKYFRQNNASLSAPAKTQCSEQKKMF
jgi:hypothetical protein